MRHLQTCFVFSKDKIQILSFRLPLVEVQKVTHLSLSRGYFVNNTKCDRTTYNRIELIPLKPQTETSSKNQKTVRMKSRFILKNLLLMLKEEIEGNPLAHIV
jgi:hypothetical protein